MPGLPAFKNISPWSNENSGVLMQQWQKGTGITVISQAAAFSRLGSIFITNKYG